jgi:CBS domain-containing protein
LSSISSFAVTGNFLFDLAILNFSLGLFNLIPAFPMDGGRVFRALLASRMKFSDATRYAVYIGKVFGIAMIIFGFLFQGYFLLILVGFFVYIGASEEGEQTIISTKLAGIRVRDVMREDFGVVNPQQAIAEALEVMFKNRSHDALVEKDGVFQGVVAWSELIKVSVEQRGSLRIEQMPLKRIFVFADDAILEANKVMARERVDLLPVVDKANSSKVVGVVTSECITDLYEEAKNR